MLSITLLYLHLMHILITACVHAPAADAADTAAPDVIATVSSATPAGPNYNKSTLLCCT